MPAVVNSRSVTGTVPEASTPLPTCETTSVPGVNGAAIPLVEMVASQASHPRYTQPRNRLMIASLSVDADPSYATLEPRFQRRRRSIQAAAPPAAMSNPVTPGSGTGTSARPLNAVLPDAMTSDVNAAESVPLSTLVVAAVSVYVHSVLALPVM